MGGVWVVLVVALYLTADAYSSPLAADECRPIPQEGHASCCLRRRAICRSPFGELFGGEMAGTARGRWGFGLFDGCLGGLIVFESL
jgi:hypothetical protein